MKKLLSIILAALLVCTVMAPLTVFAENGPFPYDPKNEDIFSTELSILGLMDTETYDTTVLYPAELGSGNSGAFSGASYNLKTNTLTLKNVKSKTAVLSATEMGDDFKINLIGYNELAGIYSDSTIRGASITITGNGELVLNRNGEFGGIIIDAYETASVLKIEDGVKLKAYSNSDLEIPSVAIFSSTVTNATELIQLGGTVVSDTPVFEQYTRAIYEQVEAYDFYWDCYDWYDYGLEKDGVYYIADEYYSDSIFSSESLYDVYAVSYDETLDCYIATPYNEEELVPIDGFTILTDYEPIYDEARGYYIGFTDEAEESDNSYKSIFIPDEKMPFDLCVDKNGKKYGFWQDEYFDEDENGNVESDVDTYIYDLIEHPIYGFVAFEDFTKDSLDGFTPIKIDEKDLADIYIESDLVINNGGVVVEPAKIKGIELKNTNQGVKVSWKADSAAEKYRVYRKADGDKDWKIIDTVGADETFIYDDTVKSGKKYSYIVRGFNYVGGGDYDPDGVSIIHLDTPKATAKNTSKGIYLKWTKIAGAEKYRIYRQAKGSTEWELVGTTKKNKFIDKTAKSGKKYNYRVRAVADGDMSSYATVGRYYLSTPKLTSASTTSAGVKVKWEKVNGAEGYKIYRKTSSKGKWKLIDTTTNNKKFNYVDKTAEDGKTYYYSVQAYYSKTTSTYNQTGLKKKFVSPS